MSDTITILGHQLKLVTPTEGTFLGKQPYYEREGSKSSPWIRAWAPDPLYGQELWQINLTSLEDRLSTAKGATLEEAEVALTAIMKEYEKKTNEVLRQMHNLLAFSSTSNLKRGPASVVVNGRTFIKEETKVYHASLVEEYRTHNSFVLNRVVSIHHPPRTQTWRVSYGTTYDGYERSKPEIALKDARESVQAQIEKAGKDIQKRQEVLKSLEDLAKDLNHD